MTLSALLIFATAASLCLNLIAGVHLYRLKSRAPKRQAFVAKPSVASVPANIGFSENENLAIGVLLGPLAEAEVFLAYGRRQDAEAVIASGLRQGLISSSEVEPFRARLARQ